MQTLIDLMERRLLPDALIRFGIRRLLAQRLRSETAREQHSNEASQILLLQELGRGAIAVHTDEANQQHYELPPEFFRRVMGEYMKYSACYWPDGINDLSAAEAAMLTLTCERAGIIDGQQILELGCGWGSLSLWLAREYPRAQITAVSNSAPQRQFIEARRDHQGLSNLTIITADMNDFSTEQRFDRVVSVEMFEHMRNYHELLARIASWLTPEGELFVHVFSHRRYAYLFETEGDDNWMGRYFFTGGVMPSRELLTRFDEHLQVAEQWHINGRHYQQTCEAWLRNQDRYRAELMPVLTATYGTAQAARWFQRWRVFFIACAELFGYRNGEEWGVSHYRFRPTSIS